MTDHTQPSGGINLHSRSTGEEETPFPQQGVGGGRDYIITPPPEELPSSKRPGRGCSREDVYQLSSFAREGKHMFWGKVTPRDKNFPIPGESQTLIHRVIAAGNKKFTESHLTNNHYA